MHRFIAVKKVLVECFQYTVIFVAKKLHVIVLHLAVTRNIFDA